VVGSDQSIYNRFKPQVESLFHTQARLCNRFLKEAEDLLKKLRPEDGSNPPEEAISRRKSACSSIVASSACLAPRA